MANGIPVGGYPKGHWDGHDFEPYFQDDWKVSHKLTLNLGLRYYYFTAYHDASAVNVDSSFVPSQYNPAAQAPLVNDPVLGPVLEPVLEPGTGYNYTMFGNGLVQCGSGVFPRDATSPIITRSGPGLALHTIPPAQAKP